MSLYSKINQRIHQASYLIFAGIFVAFLSLAFFVDAFWKSDTWFSRGDLEMLGAQNPFIQALGISIWFFVLYGAWKASQRINQAKYIRLIIPTLFLAFLGLINLFIYLLFSSACLRRCAGDSHRRR